MITVTVFNKNEEIVGVQLEGHAEFGRRGRDIVCSAVSILYINLVNSLESFTKDDLMTLTRDDVLHARGMEDNTTVAELEAKAAEKKDE